MTRMHIAAAEKALRRMEKLCCLSEREELPPAAQWLRDNARLLYSAAQQAKGDSREYQKTAYRALFAFCEQLLRENDGQVNEKILCQAVENAQAERPFTVRELRGMEHMLRICLLRRLHALLPLAENECRAYRRGALLAAEMPRGEVQTEGEDPVALCRALEILSESGLVRAARQLEALLQEGGLNSEAVLSSSEEKRMRTAQLIGHVISALRLLPRMDFGRLSEKWSVACRILMQEDTFRRMDRSGRALYLTAVQRLSERTGCGEEKICRAALHLSAQQTGVTGESGYYLLENQAALLRHLSLSPGAGAYIMGHFLPVYLFAQAFMFALFFLGGAFVLPWWGLVPFALVGVQAAQRLMQRLSARLVPPRRLPRLQGREISRAGRCLVVIPTILMDAHHTLRMVRQLSVLYLANRRAPLDFMLLSDFTDADSEKTPQDEDILSALRMGISALCDTYGDRFHALHRARTFSPGEGRYTGHERKRGALMLLCRLICGEEAGADISYATLSAQELCGRYRYVITLDADTFLPAGAAEKMILTMMHPLQAGRRHVLQPRMATLGMHVKTYAQKFLGGASGADSYESVANDFYQDVFRRGSFMGKGIIEPKGFLAAAGDLPDGRILSHDLLEGELAFGGLMSDIVCCDGHPRTVGGFLRRAHRWTRGDWQLLPFLKSSRLDLLSKFKIFDNLRRSLTPLMRVIALCASARAGAYLPFVLSLLPAFSLQGLFETLLLPASAYTRADAVLRALWRMFVSKRKLLEWTTAAQSEQNDMQSLGDVILPMLPGAALLWCAALSVHIAGFALGAVWLTQPFWRPLMDRPLREKAAVSEEDRAFLVDVARDTLRFFRDHVSARTHHLPPDNVQLSPPRGAAMRTSPTNIGMYLLSLCAARKLRLIDSDEMLTRMARTVETLEKMEKWHGHFYNWYDLHSLSPLSPRFVSSVDSGNCHVCLTAAAQCARRCMHEGDAAVRDVPARLDAICRDMQLQKLYDKREELFYIGYDAERGEATDGHYDLMASEALLLSYAAIASGQVSEKHWWRLHRAFTRVGRDKTLLSWSGTMFEYLLPALLLPAFPGTLLHAAQRGCVRAQMRHVKDGPFGISESGYAQFDEQLNYAYKAFGVPALSLSGECSDGVRAPYAAALALLTHPKEAAQALRDWKARGVYGAHGFFEAEDFTCGEVPRIVCSHMAHHQGMILCAVCNALCDEDLTKLLFALPRMRAHLPLLNERAPRFVRALPRPLRMHRDAQALPPLHIRAENALPPPMHVLSGGGVVMAQSAFGHGYIARGDVLLTRFSTALGALSGPQFYLHAVREQLSCRLTEGEYTFREGEWRVSGLLGALRTAAEGCVDPLTGAAVYRIRVRNLTEKACRTEVTAYLEPCLETMKKDAAHTAFSSLFLSVDKSGARELTVRRRLREEEGERQLRLRALSAGSGPVLCMNDRPRFIGRLGSEKSPAGLMLPEEEFTLSPSSEPCAALRLPLVVPAGREETIYFALGMGNLPENEDEAARAFSLCASRAQVMRRMLKMDARQTEMLSRLAPRLLFNDLPGKERPAAAVSQLWPQGVSGDKPFVLLHVGSRGAYAALRQLLQLLSAAFEHGLPGEAVVLLPEENEYGQPLHTMCESLLLQPALRALRGRCHLIKGAQGDFCRAAQALCCLEIDCEKDLPGALAQGEYPPALTSAACGGQLPVIDRLQRFNGYGGFTQEGGYTVLPAAHGGTPAPWSYILSNDRFGTLVCEQGILYSHAGNSRLRRITKNCQDSVLIAPSEEYLLTENGRAYSLTARPFAAGEQRVTYETGTAVYECAFEGVYAKMTCFTDVREDAGMRLLSLRNTGREMRTLTLHAAVRFAMGEDGRGTQAQAGEGCVTACSGAMPGLAFFAMAGAEAHTVSESAYAPGVDERAPQAQGAGTVGVLTREITLQGGETQECAVLVGVSAGEEDRLRMCRALLPAKERLRLVRGEWAARLGRMQFFLPDDMLSGYFNAFLPYQIRASRLQLRAGFYQSGGAFGFRDQLQDMLPLVYTEPERVRAHLLLCASRQYLEGDVQHWWHPYGAGVRTRISDDLLFLPYVTARYVYVTGDREILKAHAPYLKSKELREDEHDRYEMAETTRETGPLLEHCMKAIARVQPGPHGIPLMGGGDWNDGMDRVQGESAWLGFFYLLVLHDFAPLCDEKTRRDYEARARKLQGDLQYAFRDKWFIRAWYEDGRSIGAWDSQVPRIDLISQCFAAFAQMPRNQVVSALDHAFLHLHKEKEGITCLMEPPFAPAEKAGYIGAYLPGVRENGGQYTHAVPWFMRALLQYGRRERAWQLLHEILPYNHSFDVFSARHYRTEPYALPADVYRWGRGGWTWYTGSAAWLYDVFLRDFLGFDKKGSRVTLRPQAPESWEECTVLYHFGQSRYQLTASREMHFVTLDGARVQGEYVELHDDGKMHEARFPMGE